ncbi:putative mazG nucleotide pyrophosphohydrolase [Erwinia phage vB_EamM_Stratton]|uniref:Putative mazG nucleotide pyrophosphohydrolase n=1 Tax=Erwinia phage vB_EamM_Stratton TaxID=1883378 RepID=A0A1B2IHC0_9CAUD|nr:putative mazG nucleotide pyrophosphohydrolase [Erwinia phage vB_EamM_Stratton]
MGDRFVIQIPYNVIVNPNAYLEQINTLLAGFCHRQHATPWSFEALYSLSVNSETGSTRVEGKAKTEDGRLEINDFEMPWQLKDVEFNGKVNHPRYIPLFSVGQCIDNVLGWSAARGILENGKWDTQVTKLYEEDGEAATGISKSKERLIMDGLGDALVVLVNVMELSGIGAGKLRECFVDATLARNNSNNKVNSYGPHRLFHWMRMCLTIGNQVLYTAYDTYLENDENRGKKFSIELGETNASRHAESFIGHATHAVHAMLLLADHYNMPIEHCFSLAWDEIKDRKGLLNADGIFIKEADA